MTRKPSTNSEATVIRSRPAAMVAIQANTWIPLGIDTAMLAAEKKPSDRAGMPVANIWCTHRPKLKKPVAMRSEEHTSELQSLLRISYAVFCLKKKRQQNTNNI